MFPAQTPEIDPDEFSRCAGRDQITERGMSLSPIQETDAALQNQIYRALWNDDVLRALEYDEIGVHVKNGTVYLSGHIVSSGSQSRINNAIRAVPGITAIKNDLVLDDKLTLDVAGALGNLERAYDCKFFTGASHGVVSINGMVDHVNVKLLAEKCAADNPNVRGVINNIQVSGVKLELQGQQFLQPAISETIYFLDGVSGVVKQVILNPNNRRVTAMTIQGWFGDEDQRFKPINNGGVRPPERLIIVPMNAIRHLSKSSGFLSINSNERNRYMDFDSDYLIAPDQGWVPPYPYCTEDVLFPVWSQQADENLEDSPGGVPPILLTKEQAYREEHLANDSLGG